MSKRSTLNSSLRRHDPLEVAAGCSALLLIPANASPERLLALSARALRTQSTRWQRTRTADWLLWLRDSPSLHEGPAWDPPEGLFAAPAQFFGGGYTLIPRGEPHTVFDLQNLLEVLAIRDWPEASRPFREQALKLAMAALRISHTAASRTGLHRYENAQSAEGLVMPRGPQRDQLVAAVTFDADDIERLTDGAPEVLDPLVHDLADAPLPPARWPFELTPLVRRDDRYVLCDAAALVIALRHRLVLMAIEAGEDRALAERLGELASARVEQYCDRMDWRPLQRIGRSDDVPLKQLIFGFDLDKACDVIVVYDDLTDYDPTEPQGAWALASHTDAVMEAMREAELALVTGEGLRPNEVFHLLVIASLGRMSTFGMPSLDSPLQPAQKLLSLEALDTLTMVGVDQLSVYKCALAGARLREHARVIAFGPLDEYAAWRDNDESFYFGDDGRPNFVGFDGSHGRAIREEAARKSDLHSTRTVRGTTAPVVRLMQDVPVYGLINELTGPPHLLVEGENHRFWILSPETFAKPEHRIAYSRLIDAISFWLWQFESSLGGQPPDTDTTIVRVQIDDPEVFELDAPPPSTGPVAHAEVEDGCSVVVHVHDALVGRLYQASNEAERELVCSILDALSRAWAAAGGTGMSANEIAEAVERHAPLGIKKKINLFTLSQSTALVDAGLPEYRTVQAADSSDILDELGPELQRRLGLRVGPIPDEDRVGVLNTAAQIHFEELARLVAALSPQALLEQLVSFNEAIVHGARLTGGQLAPGSSATARRGCWKTCAARCQRPTRPQSLPAS